MYGDIGGRDKGIEMSALLTAFSDKSGFQLVQVTVGEDFLIDEDERALEILLLFAGNVIVVNIVTNFIIEHIDKSVHYCCYNSSLVGFKRHFHTNTC